jgi:diacylglycerol kinase (ATP)
MLWKDNLVFMPLIEDNFTSDTHNSEFHKQVDVREGNHQEKVTAKGKAGDTVLVVNPSSSSGLTGKDWDSLFVEIKNILGESAEVAFTEKSEDGAVLTRDFLRKGFTRIVAIGGDGTLNEVANGFFQESVGTNGNKSNSKIISSDNNIFPSPSKLEPINPNAEMGIIAGGTRNVLAKALGLPEGIIECVRTFSLGKPKTIDVISATVTNPEDHSTVNTRVFLNAAEIGLGAEIIDRSKKVRNVVNSRIVSTIAGIVSTLPAYQSNECEISLDNGQRKFKAKMTMTIVANSKYLGGEFKAAPKADMSDGKLDLVILKDSGSLKMIDELVNMKDGDYSEEDNIFYTQVKQVSIASKERDVTVSIDGEPIGILPATFEILPNALTIRM